MRKHDFIILSWALLQALSVHAGTDEDLDHFLTLSLDELMAMEVTISTNMKQNINKAPAVVTVVSAEDIKATGATNLVEVLEGVPGIHVRHSQFSNRPLVQFRGANASQTLMMVNGVSMRDMMWGFGIFWKGLPVSMIERVEIIRGPGSALFGADASAGVINVITKTAGNIQGAEVGVRTGSYNTQDVWTQYGGDWNGFDVGLSADVHGTEGHDPFIRVDGQSLQDQNFGTSVSLAPDSAQYGWRSEELRLSVAREHWQFLADYSRQHDLEIGLTGAGVLDPVTRASDTRYDLGLLYSNNTFSKDWGLNAQLHYNHLDYTSGNGFQERPPGFIDATGIYPDGVINQMRSAERRLNFESSGLYYGLESHAVQLGVGRTWQDLYYVEQFINSGTGPDGNPLLPGGELVDLSDTPYAFAPEKMRIINYLFLQDVWTLSDAWELTAGARYDHYSDFGDTLNPRLALVWQSTDKLTTKLMYGEAFRAPSYQELFAETSFTLPNPDLDPERSHTGELSFSYTATRDLRLGLSVYHFYQSNLIRAISVAGVPKRQFQNSGQHTIRGLELEAQWQATRALMISGNYSLRNQEDNQHRAVDEPDRDAYMRVDWGFRPGWNLNIQTSWIGERPRASGDSRTPVAAYSLTDTTLRYSSPGDWELATSVRNLMDIDAREYTGSSIPDDLPLAGRHVYAEMRYKF